MDMVFFINFLGWCTLINVGFLLVSSVLLFLFKDPISQIHHRMTGVEPDKLMSLYFQYLAHYKIFIIVFNLVPYIALKIIG